MELYTYMYPWHDFLPLSSIPRERERDKERERGREGGREREGEREREGGREGERERERLTDLCEAATLSRPRLSVNCVATTAWSTFSITYSGPW